MTTRSLRDGICIAMISSRPVLNSEVILLEMFQPMGNLAFWETKGKQPVKGCVTCPEDKSSTIKVRMKVLDSFHHCQ